MDEARPPLRFYEDFFAFKLFMHDVGLLGEMSDDFALAFTFGRGITLEIQLDFAEGGGRVEFDRCAVSGDKSEPIVANVVSDCVAKVLCGRLGDQRSGRCCADATEDYCHFTA